MDGMGTMNARKFFMTGLITGFVFLMLDMFIAIATGPLLSPFSGLPIWRNPPNIAAGAVFDIINGFILAGIFMVMYKGIPGSGWRKGANFGIIVGLLRTVMSSFSALVMYATPAEVVMIQLVSGYAEIVILCVILSLVYERV